MGRVLVTTALCVAFCCVLIAVGYVSFQLIAAIELGWREGCSFNIACRPSLTPKQIVEQDFSLFDGRVTSESDRYLYDPKTFITEKLPSHQFRCGGGICQVNGGWAR